MTDDALNERLALALGWTHHPSYAGYMVPPGGLPEMWGVRDIEPPSLLSGDGMLAVLEAMKQQPERVWTDFTYEVMQRVVPNPRTLDDIAQWEQPCPHFVVQRLLMDLTPRLVAECALAALEKNDE